MKIPGVFLCLLFPAVAFAECGKPSGELLQVARVSDGDTLKLQDGRSVRVLGMNAPEVTHGKHAGQPLSSKSLRGDETGFRLVSGRVAKVDMNSAVWLELDGKLVLRVAKKDWPLFGSKQSWLDLKGRKLEVRGWISAQKSKRSQRFKPLVMQLRSPTSLKVKAN